MNKLKFIVAKKGIPEEQFLKDTLSNNIRIFRHRRNWSQFVLSEKANISTNFLADIEAGNTWVSAQTLVKLAKAFEIEVFELLKPHEQDVNHKLQHENDINKTILSKFSQDLTVVLQEAMEKALKHVKKQYKIK